MTSRIFVRRCHCYKCGHDWPSFKKRPSNCPNCKSSSWDKLYKRQDMLGKEK